MQNTFKIDNKLSIVRVPLAVASAAPVLTRPPTDYAFVCDVSGSMSCTLHQMGEQIAEEIGRLVGPQDTFSLIVFSGRGECEVVLRAEPIGSITDLSAIKAKVRQFLRPIGLTGFVDPLRAIGSLADYLKGMGRSLLSVLFLTDGGDNQWRREEVMEALRKIEGVAAWTFVQYGAWADGPFLAKMAEQVGGNVVFANDFRRYQPVFAAQFGKSVSTACVEVKITRESAVGGVLFGLRGSDIFVLMIPDGATSVQVPADLGTVFYLTDKGTGMTGVEAVEKGADPDTITGALYAAVSLFAQRMQSKVVLPLLRYLGDKALTEKYGRAFGSVLVGEFATVASKAATGEGRFATGYDPNCVPAADAFTILDLFRAIVSDNGNRFRADSDDFKYSPIGRRTVDPSDRLTPEEETKINDLTAAMSATKSVTKKKDIQAQIKAIMDAKQGPIKFVADPAPDGYPIDDLVLNNEFPNISFRIYRKGTADLTGRIPDEFAGKIPEQFRTGKFKTYAIVAHGVTNVDALPCKITRPTWENLAKRGVVSGPYTDGVVTFDLSSMPVINQQMIQDVSAQALFEMEYERLVLKGQRKVYDYYMDQLYPKLDAKTVSAFGPEATEWLKAHNLTTTSFNPGGPQADSTDEITGRKMHVVMEGLAALPSVADVHKKLAALEKYTLEKGKGKKPELTPSQALMAPPILEVEKKIGATTASLIKSKDPAQLVEAQSLASKDAKVKTYLEKHSKAADERILDLSYKIAQIKFAIAVGQVWPIEWAGDTSKNTLAINTPSGDSIQGTLKVEPVQIKI